MAKAWVRMAPNILAEVEYEEVQYELGDQEIDAHWTGRLRMTRKAVLDAKYDDLLVDPAENAES
jgi:hypothetical protein